MFELNIADILGLVSLLFGGGAIGGILTWKYTKSKAEAEAKLAQAEAEKAEVDTSQAVADMMGTIQDGYQKMIEAQNNHMEEMKKYSEQQKAYISEQNNYIKELKDDRDDLRIERNKMQKRLGQLNDELDDVKRTVARQGRQIEGMRPFLCADTKCKKRVLVAAWESGISSKPASTDETANP